MLRRATLMLTLASITAVVLAVVAGGAPAAEGEPIYCSGKVCKGDSGDNLIIGTNKNDDINPFGGDDTVYAKGGDDYVHHSYGNDVIDGGPGNDTLRGGFDNDVIWGGPGRDLIDCAYLESRDKGEAYDTAYANRADGDVVVDCKTVYWEQDRTDDTTRIESIDPDKRDRAAQAGLMRAGPLRLCRVHMPVTDRQPLLAGNAAPSASRLPAQTTDIRAGAVARCQRSTPETPPGC
jgi:Ca2+-binding RTX toxin-like protein